MGRMRRFLHTNALMLATITSVALGVAVGVLCRQTNLSADTILLVGFPGEILLRMMKLLMLPLIISSIITGMGSMTGTSGGKMGIVSILYYISSTIIAVLIALSLGFTIRPGAHSDLALGDTETDYDDKLSGLDMLLDLIRNMVPDNIFGSTIQHSRTVTIISDDGSEVANITRMLANTSLVNRSVVTASVKKEVQLFDGANMIGVLLYCVVFGIILGKQAQRGIVVMELFASINAITLQMIKLVMWYTPIGIVFLIASQIMSAQDLSSTGRTLGLYLTAELLACSLHLLVALPIFYFLLTRGNAFKIYIGALQALLTAFTTSSSAATLPVTMQCVEKRLKKDGRIAGLVLPIGMTVNMDGASVFLALAPLFIAQFNDINLSFPSVLIISLTGLLMSIGAAAVPGNGVSTILLMLRAIGLPHRGIAFLLTIDWLTDRVRTVVNVASDCLAVGVVCHYIVLPPLEREGFQMISSPLTSSPQNVELSVENEDPKQSQTR